MSFDLSQFLKCSYGTAAMWLVSYDAREEASVKDGFRDATNVTVTATAHVVCTTGNTSDFAAQLASVISDLRIDGRDLIIVGLAGIVEYRLLQATAIAGPFVSFEILDAPPAGPLSKAIRITVRSAQYPAAKDLTFKVVTQTRPDGTRIVTTTGEVIGPNSGDYFTANILPRVNAAYPLPDWVLEYTVDSTQDGNLSKTTYTVKAIDLAGTLPAAAGGATAVAGEVTMSVDTDEQHRKMTKLDVDVLIGRDDDPVTLINQMRTQAAGANSLILRESYSFTTVEQRKIRASFSVISSGDRTPLLNWTETVQIQYADGGWDIKTYPGAQPIVVHRPATIARIRQSGMATAVGKFKAPTPIYNSFLEPPQVTLRDINDVEKETSWSFDMYPSLAGNAPDTGFSPGSFDPTPLSRAAQDNNYFKTKAGT